jgi:hypothetical protein
MEQQRETNLSTFALLKIAAAQMQAGYSNFLRPALCYTYDSRAL